MLYVYFTFIFATTTARPADGGVVLCLFLSVDPDGTYIAEGDIFFIASFYTRLLTERGSRAPLSITLLAESFLRN